MHETLSTMMAGRVVFINRYFHLDDMVLYSSI